MTSMMGVIEDLSPAEQTPIGRPVIPTWAALLMEFQRRAVWDAPGAKWIKMAWVINLHKLLCPIVVLAMMAGFQDYSTGAWIYLGLHGFYGLCWVIKDVSFGDKRWKQRVSSLGALNVNLIVLALYWLIPLGYFLAERELTNPEMALGVGLCLTGMALMIGADAQRHFTLKFRKGLITDGLFRRTRNPNYLGETLIYLAFAVIAHHWLGWAVFAYAVLCVFIPNMLAKDVSISRHPGWEQYRQQSNLYLPIKALLR